MTTQPDPTGWGWSDRREIYSRLDAIDRHLSDLSNRNTALVTTSEYAADKRTENLVLNNLQEKLDEIESKIRDCVKEQRDSINQIRRELSDEDDKIEHQIHAEVENRRKQREDDQKARQSQVRFIVSMILIPIVLTVVQLLMSHR